MSQQQASSSLLSLSIAASNAQPIPLPGQSAKHHRRLSSTGKTRRRLSDARDAANRPTPATAAALSLASLSLSSSPPSAHHNSASIGSASDALIGSPTQGSVLQILKLESPENPSSSPGLSSDAASPIPIANGKNRKRGVDHKCESCSKIYRHPSCLIKHRWEHTPHWREASKYVLSKHQQVQLLEAAAILSHLSPSSSLPEDRSLWPSFLSGGSLPPPESANLTTYSPHVSTGYNTVSPGHSPIASKHTSSSVPTLGTDYLRSSSYPTNVAGPRLHDYDLPTSNNGLAQLRPGLVGIPNANANGIAETTTPTLAGLAISVPTRTSVPPLMEEDEDSKRGKFSSPAEDSLPRSRSASVSTSGEEDDEMSGEKPWRSFVGRRYSDDGEEHGEWRGFGRDAKPKNRVHEWDGIDMEMEMD
ncbi:hypothetical protein AX14_014432 [Amanita brunnescens Koide BX004]|nr:hypothetical protein AX14_014432 [Amanita brunnescens Koide BX004]